MKKILSGKVREVYEVDGDTLAIVTTDRISAFDVILSSEIPGKGKALNRISNFWFDFTKNTVPNHIISENIGDMPEFFSEDINYYHNRTILVKKLKMLPFEIIVRGYIFGNMWNSYNEGKEFCGQKITGDYKLADKLSAPIITPSLKNKEGHDEYISMERFYSEAGEALARQICETSLKLYNACYERAVSSGIIIADTKFEFGIDADGVLTLADEIFTPDSSRFWDAGAYKVGESPKSYDKQFVRDWLIENHLDGATPAPMLPENVIKTTSSLYVDCYRKLTGQNW